MDYSFKITTHGRAVLAACLDLSKPLKLTRAAVGSGLADQDEDLAKVHALVRYAAEASIADRRHEGDRLFLTVRYCNKDHPNTGTFTLSEFMVWAEDPETGRETDFLYATLGDFRQSVPGYSEQFPESTFSYPLVLVVSGELQVSITASPGLVTWDEMMTVLNREVVAAISAALSVCVGVENIPVAIPVDAWAREETSTGLYAYYAEAADEKISASHLPDVILDVASMDIAAACGLCPTVTAKTGTLCFYAQAVPTDTIIGVCRLWKSGNGLPQSFCIAPIASDAEVDGVLDDIFGHKP